MKNIQEKYCKTQLNYINLDKLKFKVVRMKDDNFYKIVDNTKIRRNYSFTSEEIIKQSTLFDLGDMFLLSKVHIRDSNLMKMKIEIAPSLQGPWVAVENDITIVSGKIRVLKIGSLPCRFFRLTVIKGCPIMDFKKIECFGLNINDIKSKYDEDTLDMLYYNSYDLIYRKVNSNFSSQYNSINNSKYHNSMSYKGNDNLDKKNELSESENINNIYNNNNNDNFYSYVSYNSNEVENDNMTYNYTKSKGNTSNYLYSSDNSTNYNNIKTKNFQTGNEKGKGDYDADIKFQLKMKKKDEKNKKGFELNSSN